MDTIRYEQQQSTYRYDSVSGSISTDKDKRIYLTNLLRDKQVLICSEHIDAEVLYNSNPGFSGKMQSKAVMDGTVLVNCIYDSSERTGQIKANEPVVLCYIDGKSCTGINTAWSPAEYKIVGIATETMQYNGTRKIPVRLINPGQAKTDDGVPFYNSTSEVVPPGGAMVPQYNREGGYYICGKCSNEMHPFYLVNKMDSPVQPYSYGMGTWLEKAGLVLVSQKSSSIDTQGMNPTQIANSVVVNFEMPDSRCFEYGVQSGSFGLTSYRPGFRVSEIVQIGNLKYVVAIQRPVSKLVGKCSYAQSMHPEYQSIEINFKPWMDNVIRESEYTVTGFSLSEIDAGKWLSADMVNGVWLVHQIQC